MSDIGIVRRYYMYVGIGKPDLASALSVTQRIGQSSQAIQLIHRRNAVEFAKENCDVKPVVYILL